jgi:hypothetical protein
LLLKATVPPDQRPVPRPLGTAVADRLPQKLLARGFAVIVALLALFLLADATLLGGPPKG